MILFASPLSDSRTLFRKLRVVPCCAAATALLAALVCTAPAVGQTCTVDQVTDTTGDPNFPASNGDPTISADGLFVAFQSDAEPVPGSNPEGNSEIWLYDVVADAFTQVTSTTTGNSARPEISADGQWVVFEGSPELFPGSLSQIALYDVAGASILQVTALASGAVLYPAVNGDGTLVAFASTADIVPGGNGDGNRELFLYDRVNNDFTQVTNTSGGSTELSSLDDAGTLLAFNSTADVVPLGNADANSEIFLHDIAAAATVQITQTTAGGNFAPNLSGDGAFLAFQSNRDLVPPDNADGSVEIFLYDIPGAAFSQVTQRFGVESYNPSLSHDGTRLAFASFNNHVGVENPDGNNELFLYDRSTDQISQITSTVGPGFFYMMETAISGDGTVIAFDSHSDITGDNWEQNGEIHLADCGTQAPDPAPAIPVLSGVGVFVLTLVFGLAALGLLRRCSS